VKEANNLRPGVRGLESALNRSMVGNHRAKIKHSAIPHGSTAPRSD